MFENKHLKVKLITFNEGAAFLAVMVTFPVVLWMVQCLWLCRARSLIGLVAPQEKGLLNSSLL